MRDDLFVSQGKKGIIGDRSIGKSAKFTLSVLRHFLKNQILLVLVLDKPSLYPGDYLPKFRRRSYLLLCVQVEEGCGKSIGLPVFECRLAFHILRLHHTAR